MSELLNGVPVVSNNNQRKVKTKILKSNNNPLILEKLKTSNQPILQISANEHRSHTPNVE